MSPDSPTSVAASSARTFRLPRSAYLIVLFLVFCTVPLAFGDSVVHTAADDASGTSISNVHIGPQIIVLLIPIAAVLFIARTATIVDGTGIRVRAMFGARALPWERVRGLSVTERSVYAVCTDGSVRLPCVRVANLAALSLASGGRLPRVAAPRPKAPPSRRPRGRRVAR